MSTSKKTHDLIRQNEKVVKNPHKHETNLQKNSVLYFQVGLIVCLLAAYGLLEMQFETTTTKFVEVVPIDDPDNIYVDVIFKPEELKREELVVQKRTKLTDKEPIIKEDDFNKETPDIFKPPLITNKPIIDPSHVKPVPKIEEPENVLFVFIQDAPIYPGCENVKGNDERKKCMSDKISKLIRKQFNGSDVASQYGLTGIQKIDVQFKIDKTGHVTDIMSRAPHPKLAEEAERVVNKIPEMTPGKQRDKPVGVIYTLPIIFQVEN